MMEAEQAKGTPEERGIPKAQFLDDVGAFLTKHESAEVALKEMQAAYRYYKLLEAKLVQSKANLRAKIPDIRNALSMVQYLLSRKSGEEVSTHFELSEGVFAKASLQNVDTVCLWLGANVMVEYSTEEANALLTRNLESATQNLEMVQQDLDFLKDQITITEVNMARVFNFDVKQRRQGKSAGSSSS
ncbi:Prefoldin subunit 3 [Balamuthia mandrillaris]